MRRAIEIATVAGVAGVSVAVIVVLISAAGALWEGPPGAWSGRVVDWLEVLAVGGAAGVSLWLGLNSNSREDRRESRAEADKVEAQLNGLALAANNIRSARRILAELSRDVNNRHAEHHSAFGGDYYRPEFVPDVTVSPAVKRLRRLIADFPDPYKFAWPDELHRVRTRLTEAVEQFEERAAPIVGFDATPFSTVQDAIRRGRIAMMGASTELSGYSRGWEARHRHLKR